MEDSDFGFLIPEFPRTRSGVLEFWFRMESIRKKTLPFRYCSQNYYLRRFFVDF